MDTPTAFKDIDALMSNTVQGIIEFVACDVCGIKAEAETDRDVSELEVTRVSALDLPGIFPEALPRNEFTGPCRGVGAHQACKCCRPSAWGVGGRGGARHGRAHASGESACDTVGRACEIGGFWNCTSTRSSGKCAVWAGE